MNPDEFASSHLLTPQKPASECYVVEQLIGTIAEWSVHDALLDAVGRLRAVRNSTENLH